MTQEDQRAYDIVRKLFKNDYGEPFEMTEGQIRLFRAIYEKQYSRTQFECYTQYGKSDVVSMAVLLRASTFPEKWPIVGGTKEKAQIIMNKVIKHLFENEYTLSKFQIGKDESVERIKRERSKDRITFKVDEKGNVGEILVLSADARRKTQDAGDILIGHGAPNLIEDDAALIPDPIHGKAMRMLGGHVDNFLLKITNNFGRNHAYRSSIDPKFQVFKIDYIQGIAEGRITPEYIEEMRGLLDPIMFGVLYECKYPPADIVEDGGWIPLLTEEQIDQAEKRVVEASGYRKLGADIAEGTNYNSFVIRTDNLARVKEKTLEKDLMKTADKTVEIIRFDNIMAENVFVDAVGSGSGVYSRLKQMGVTVNGIKAGEKPTQKTEIEKKLDPIEFYNLRAEMYWNLKNWIRQGGALEAHPDWKKQLTKIRYKESADKKIQIMPKEEMRARGLISAMESPDTADALAFTFAPKTIIKFNKTATPALPSYYPDVGY